MKESKLFKDPVHGYIEIPLDYVSSFIDTPIFQRLRNIEQTSMRPLYPAARHDRFIHSLGVFYLGKKAFEAIENNGSCLGDMLKEEDVNRLKKSFEIACLLHDCGHAPCSHTFEHYYNYPVDSNTGKGRILREFEKHISEKFVSDLSEEALPAPHELSSATIVVTEFQSSIEKLNGEPELVARMITGCKHIDVNTQRERVENCLIELLNGAPVDVDKLDYTLRDTWVSGVKNVSIDVDRLLKSLFIDQENDRPVLCFYRSALSVIQSVVNGRNYLYRWVYCHHSVLYQAELLVRASAKLAKIMSIESDPDSFWKTFVSTDALINPQILGGRKFFLPSDGDLFCLLKEHYSEIQEAEELLSRSPKRFPLWKTYAQFDTIFKRIHAKQSSLDVLENKATRELDLKFQTDIGFMTIPAKAKLRGIDKNQILMRIEKENIPFDTLFPQSDDVERYFYVYAPQALRYKRDDIISALYSICQ